MGAIRARSGKLFLDFTYNGIRCREMTNLADNKLNKSRLERLLKTIEAEIVLGKFNFEKYFPNSAKLAVVQQSELAKQIYKTGRSNAPLFKDFANVWFHEKQVEWRQSYIDTVRNVLDAHILHRFGDCRINEITKQDVMTFRAYLSQLNGRAGKKLSPSRINHIMTPLRVILNEAADRYQFVTPWVNIKALKIPRTDIQPFSLEEVKRILETVRADFKPYFTVRFFTGLRSGEIDGLMWKHVKLDEGLILVHQSLVRGELVSTKTDGSFRNVQISEPVRQALLAQEKLTKGKTEYVFANRKGNPLDNRNVTQKIWYPLLRFLELEERTPYQTRHTAATLLLAAGESPEWIAKQLGHSTTTMLFRVYSRYVPNLTRQDGSAFERLLQESEDQL